jgi:hypothetical protein
MGRRFKDCYLANLQALTGHPYASESAGEWVDYVSFTNVGNMFCRILITYEFWLTWITYPACF